jgi:hypothetical protein
VLVTYQISMLLGADPQMTVAPSAELPQFLYLGMMELHVVLDGKSMGVEDSNIASKAKQDAASFVGQQSRV